jgi:hypothetical protein
MIKEAALTITIDWDRKIGGRKNGIFESRSGNA